EGRPVTLLGSTARRVFALAQNTLDGCDAGRGPTAGTVASATLTSLTGSQAFAPDAAGCPVVITGGRGRGQLRRVTAVAGARLDVATPWRVRPNASSTYQVGGAQWVWRSGWFRWADEEEDNRREITVS